MLGVNCQRRGVDSSSSSRCLIYTYLYAAQNARGRLGNDRTALTALEIRGGGIAFSRKDESYMVAFVRAATFPLPPFCGKLCVCYRCGIGGEERRGRPLEFNRGCISSLLGENWRMF